MCSVMRQIAVCVLCENCCMWHVGCVCTVMGQTPACVLYDNLLNVFCGLTICCMYPVVRKIAVYVECEKLLIVYCGGRKCLYVYSGTNGCMCTVV